MRLHTEIKQIEECVQASSPSLSEAARRHLQAERGPQHVGDLRQRYAHLGVQLDDQRDDAGAALRAGRAQRIRCLKRVAALHSLLTPRAAAHLDIKAAHDGIHRQEVFLVFRSPADHLDCAAAVRTPGRCRHRVVLVDPRRARAAPLAPVGRTGPPPRTPAASGRSLAKGAAGRLPKSGSARGGQLLLDVVYLPLQAVVVWLLAQQSRPW